MDAHRAVRGTGGRLLDAVQRRLLRGCTLYQRAVAYFSSSAMACAGDEFSSFFEEGGTYEIVCSPNVTSADLDVLRRYVSGLENRYTSLGDALASPLALRGLALLEWGLFSRRIKFKVARTVKGGLYHEKIGVGLKDSRLLIAFTGSANESSAAYMSNFERIDVRHCTCVARGLCSACALVTDFRSLWTNRTPNLEILPLSRAVRDGLLVANKPMSGAQSGVLSDSAGDTDMPIRDVALVRPEHISLRPYQREACEWWLQHGGKGILSMATGTGKTVTALSIASAVSRAFREPLAVIVVAPFINLVDQWAEEALDWGAVPIRCYGSQASWAGRLRSATYLANTGRSRVLFAVATAATFRSSEFQASLQLLRVRTLLIADEVHNLGARQFRKALAPHLALRLGLSATPERWGDEAGTGALYDYFGHETFDFGLAEALAYSPPILTPYTYTPIPVALEPDEEEEYLRLTRRIARYVKDADFNALSPEALALLLRRSRLVASARGKLAALKAAMLPHRDTSYNIVYCGDGFLDLTAIGELEQNPPTHATQTRQIEAVMRLLGTDLGMSAATYTSRESPPQRREALQAFRDGRRQALVAIRCLDEGIDVPAARRAFILASTTNPRQFIQRRGRILRRSEGKDRAEIYDFVVVPPLELENEEEGTRRCLRSLVAREMTRVLEFARLAQNSAVARQRLLPMLKALDLLHLA